MLSEADSLPDGVLEAMEYLSRSENRMRILYALSQRPFAQRELVEDTGIPRSTLRRIITEMTERGWAERTLDGEYVATPTGALMITETERYIGGIEAIQTLDTAVSWLPDDELLIELHHFRDARVVSTQANEAVAPDTYAIERIRESTEFRNLTNIAPTLGFERVMHDGVEAGTLSTEHVVTPGVIRQLCTDDERQSRWRKYLDAGANLYRYDGQIPCNLFIMDETVFIADSQLERLEFVEVDDSTVLSWAHNVIDTYRQDAERLRGNQFTAESGVSTDE